MKRRPIKYLLLVLLGLGATGFAFAYGGADAKESLRAAQNGEPGAEARPLKEKAKLNGRFIGLERPREDDRYSTLAELASHSVAVVIGTARQGVCRLSLDGKNIRTDYSVSVEHSYKGQLRQGDNISVSLPGGFVKFADGSSAEIRTPWFKKMEPGKTYLLFLRGSNRRGAFATTGQAQGVFEIPTTRESRAVKTHSGVLRDPVWKYHNMNVGDFLREVRQLFGQAGARQP